ncbi:class I adenylate-forming enzyme family protein [Bacillus alveayuensis]|uniref:class I adenylate-forming enzyme family protein n=1 Tax=Aeribacillus alveayuensis TaxID=279215 RepID=UPI0005D0FA91|nr:long-chain fatty acid--CoA ligase [Bacillus alveayuensis]
MDVGFITRQIESVFQTVAPNKKAIQLENKQSWTYDELNRISNRYANQLKQLGIKKGDRIGIILYNSLEYFGLYFAAAKMGAIAVRLNFRLSSAELEYAINDAGVKILCFHSELTDRLEPIRKFVQVEHYICLQYKDYDIPHWAYDWSLLEDGSEESISEEVYPDDPVMLMYTSGTTGRPKGAIWTHHNTLWFSAMQVMKWGFTGEEIAMTTGPLYHVGAMEDLALPILMMGGTVIITESKGFDIKRVLSVIDSEQVTDCFLFPFMIYDMLHLEDFHQYRLSSLKRIYTGGDPIMPWAIEALKEKHPSIGLIQVYGLTEGTPIAAALDPHDVLSKNHTVGKPLPLTEIKIANEDGEEVKAGEVGEIVIKSPAVSKGYWGKPRATAETFVNGWCKTGDLGQFDEDGYLIIAGRKKDMIRSGGENIYAAEIEDVLYRLEGVKDAAVIGIPDPTYIETVCAVIVKKQGYDLQEQEVVEHCKTHLASYKKPRKVVFVNELPRTPSGKVQKYVLREQFRININEWNRNQK